MMVAQTKIDTKKKMLAFVSSQQEELKQLEEDFSSGKIKRVSTFANKAAKFSAKKSGSRKIWKAVCENENITPREYLVPDMQAITNALKSGHHVTGWKWQQVDQIAI